MDEKSNNLGEAATWLRGILRLWFRSALMDHPAIPDGGDDMDKSNKMNLRSF
jgi:hypothetical protein